jgi:hypothetical protein
MRSRRGGDATAILKKLGICSIINSGGNYCMETKRHGNGIVEFIDAAVLIKEANDVLDLIFMENCSTILVRKENITDDFFDLSTGVAGAILQKFSNYRKRMAIIGDFEGVESKSLKDFIYESNRTKQILFVKTREEALKIFTGP